VKRHRKIEPPDVTALVGSRLRPDEYVESVHQDRRDKVTVFLAETDPEVQRITAEFGLGGCGRTLEFAHKSGRWVFVGEGAWRS
jgi:hypothetical protein